MDITDLTLEGDVNDIAEQIFQQLVSKVYEEIKKQNPDKASEFAFCIAGNAIGCLFTITKPNKVAKVKSLMFRCVDDIAVQVMQNRKTKFS
ncbi:hypothetical protein G9F32_02935 [Acinetobacter sp. 194]|uniref:hypothetical protein n=1 Tax=Acinetobacter shaoyimingii TaxID=2715164 RepID=UPI00140CABFF|nr:hypothetical protein [Acinetobacter shaoyimingii]NHB56990.1 hypothetical protein [Acinetobacter shaoyimingii]